MYDSWNNNPKILLVLKFFFCVVKLVNITGDIKNFVQIYFFLNKTKIVEILTKFF